MLSYLWPIALIVFSNTLYQVCAKSVPEGMNPFASLTVTYLVGALLSGILYFALGNGGNLLNEYSKMNWAPVVLGLVIVGLEAGYIFAFKAGWQVSTAQVVQAALLAGVLLFALGAYLAEAFDFQTEQGSHEQTERREDHDPYPEEFAAKEGGRA